jgi:hypothetical protein
MYTVCVSYREVRLYDRLLCVFLLLYHADDDVSPIVFTSNIYAHTPPCVFR